MLKKIIIFSLNFCIYIYCIYLIGISNAYSNPLEDVMKSDEYGKISSSNSNYESKPISVDEDSNYWKIFTDKDAKKLLENWLGSSSSDFEIVQSDLISRPEFVELDQVFKEKTTSYDYSLRILIPRPMSKTLIQLKLIREFLDIEPPRLRIEKDQILKLSGIEAKFYGHKNKDCSIVIPYEKDIVFNLLSKECIKPSNLSKIFEGLDLKRFKNKLES